MDNQPTLWKICCAPLFAWLALCALLGLTVALAYVPMGRGNLFVSLLIAALKASLVGLVFMELTNRNATLNRLAAAAGPIWIFVMFLLIFADYLTR